MKIKDYVWIIVAIILTGLFFYSGGRIVIGKDNRPSDFEIYCQVEEKLTERCQFTIDTISTLYPKDLYFEKASKFVTYRKNEFSKDYITIWYTTDIAIFEKSLDSSFFRSIVVPANLLLGDREDLVAWIKKEHKLKKLNEKTHVRK